MRPWTSVRKCERKFAPPTQRKALRSSYPRAMVPGRLFPNRRWAEYLDEWQDDPARRGAQLTNASAARSHSPDRSKCKLRLCLRACGILRVSRWMRGKEACIDSRWLNVLHILCKNPRNLEHSSTSVDSSSVASGLRDGAACAKRPTTHTRSGMFRVRWLSSGGPSVGPT